MQVFPKAIVLTTKSHFDVKKMHASVRGLVVKTIALGITRISAIKDRNLQRELIGAVITMNVLKAWCFGSCSLSKIHGLLDCVPTAKDSVTSRANRIKLCSVTLKGSVFMNDEK